jgi:diaminopimelate epimerase
MLNMEGSGSAVCGNGRTADYILELNLVAAVSGQCSVMTVYQSAD